MDTHSQLRQVGLFDARVPRYTSYPPANRFSGAISAAESSDWIESLGEGARISVYVHVPFCRRLCWFCACRTQGTSTLGPIERYVQGLEEELALLGQTLPEGVEIEHLHWGGGTPTLLSPELIDRLATAIGQAAPLAEGAEFSVEIDPNEFDAERLEALARAGMTRASIGVQDFDPAIQTAIGRQQSFEVTRDTVDLLRAAGITSLNMDILYGLPGQTLPGIADSVQKVLSLSPDRVALYGYAHVPWMARRQRLIPADDLPGPEARLDLFERAERLFSWDGYERIGIDHFARPGDSMAQAAKDGRLRRNFQGYTTDACEVLIGVGASAISRFPQGYAQNTPATSEYLARVGAGQLATARGHKLTLGETRRAALIEELLCYFEADLSDLAVRLDGGLSELMNLARQMSERFEGAIEWPSYARIRIRPDLRPAARLIVSSIDETCDPTASRSHSHAT